MFEEPRFEQYEVDVCVFRLIEDGYVAITAVVHVELWYRRIDMAVFVWT